MPRHATAPSAANRLLGLELLRCLAAFGVLLAHYPHFAVDGVTVVDYVQQRQPFYDEIGLLYTYGKFGVQAFWAISGYIFFYKYRDSIAARTIHWREFALLRFTRLYPLHVLTLLAVVVLQYIYRTQHGAPFMYDRNTPENFILQLFMAANWIEPRAYNFNAPIWSVSLEILVYALFFLQIRLVGTSQFFRLAFLIAGFVGMTAEMHPIFECAFFFYLGGTIWEMFRNTDAADHDRYRTLALLTLAVATLLFLVIDRVDSVEQVRIALACLLPPTLYLAAYHARFGRLERLVETFGNISFGVYLVHFPLQIAVLCLLTAIGQKASMYSAWFFLTNMLLPVAVALVVHERFERPAQEYLRARFLRTRSQPLVVLDHAR